jgi:hypothetical protein
MWHLHVFLACLHAEQLVPATCEQQLRVWPSATMWSAAMHESDQAATILACSLVQINAQALIGSARTAGGHGRHSAG